MSIGLYWTVVRASGQWEDEKRNKESIINLNLILGSSFHALLFNHYFHFYLVSAFNVLILASFLHTHLMFTLLPVDSLEVVKSLFTGPAVGQREV